MLGFAIQNFYKNFPLIIKTYKYVKLINYINVVLLSFFVKTNFFFLRKNYIYNRIWNYANIIYYLYNIRPFWLILKSLKDIQMGIYSNALTTSLLVHTLTTLSNLVSKNLTKSKLPKRVNGYNIIYVKYIPILNFSNLNSTYNLFTFYFMYFLIANYNSICYNFKSWYSFVLLQPLSYFYNLQSKFFFKIRHF